MKHHKKNSKRQKLSLKYNVQKRVRETKRRVRKQAKKMGLDKKSKKKKDPGIPNTWPFKAELLAEIERKKEQKEQEVLKKRAESKAKAQKEQQKEIKNKRFLQREKEREKRDKLAEIVKRQQSEALRKVLNSSEVLLEVLDARDPQGCRCSALEQWALENNKRVIFVLTKCDLVSPQLVVRWMAALGREGPTVATQVEAGRDGVPELLRLLGYNSKSPVAGNAGVPAAAAAGALPEVKGVGVIGYSGTGKKALVKAIKQESKTAQKWLVDAVGCLRPKGLEETTEVQRALHCALRGLPLKGPAWNAATATKAADDEAGPIAVVKHFLQRTQPAHIMRRLRLPAFSSVQDLLVAYGKEQKLVSKTGKDAAPERVARQMMLKLPEKPSCCCAPADASPDAKPLWKHHATGEAAIKALMESQAAVLGTRDAGGVAIEVTSAGYGPEMDIASALKEEDSDVEGDSDEDMSDDDMAEGGEEGEEEEFLEESEEEGMSDV
eukprot:TRINITY_DN74461_c0_g1_i1.p1 TRINITY_DN74461_c0_g1~~TRINITY_DN74461_c0_g1_i1.p1  ORF type:complete len:494 (-),score=171.56 TRINITY_DN74461_c0_g1_i1:322-1803(-)